MIAGHTDGVTSVAFSPDGLTLASGAGDRTVRLWDVKTGQPKATLAGHEYEVISVAFSPDGQHIFGWDWPGYVLAWTVSDGKPADPANPPPRSSGGRATSADDTLRVEARGNVVALIDLVLVERDRAERLALEPVNRIWWHQQHAAQAEQDRDYFAADFHLRQLLKDKPDDTTVIQRHALTLLRLALVESECGDVDASKRHWDDAGKANRTAWPAAARQQFDQLHAEIERKLATARMDKVP